LKTKDALCDDRRKQEGEEERLAYLAARLCIASYVLYNGKMRKRLQKFSKKRKKVARRERSPYRPTFAIFYARRPPF
jgi:hypothetical protein